MADYSKALEIDSGVLIDGTLVSTPIGGVVANATALDGYIPMDGRHVALSEYPLLSEIPDVTAGDQIDLYPVTNTQLNAVIGNGSVYVACGNTGKIFTSIDRINWTQQTSGTTQNLNSLSYSSLGLFVVGNGEVIKRSSNGVTWNNVTVVGGTGRDLRGIYATNNAVIAVGARGETLYSTNGTEFTTYLTGNYLEHKDIVFDGTNWVIVGNYILTSNNGTTWITRQSANLNHVSFYGNLLVAVGDTGIIQTSTDHGLTWTTRASGVTTNIYSVAYIDDYWIAITTNALLRSIDAITWIVLPKTYSWLGKISVCADEDEVLFPTSTGSIGVIHAASTGYKYIPKLDHPCPWLAKYYIRGK